MIGNIDTNMAQRMKILIVGFCVSQETVPECRHTLAFWSGRVGLQLDLFAHLLDWRRPCWSCTPLFNKVVGFVSCCGFFAGSLRDVLGWPSMWPGSIWQEWTVHFQSNTTGFFRCFSPVKNTSLKDCRLKWARKAATRKPQELSKKATLHKCCPGRNGNSDNGWLIARIKTHRTRFRSEAGLAHAFPQQVDATPLAASNAARDCSPHLP